MYSPGYPRNSRIRAFLEQQLDAEIRLVAPAEGRYRLIRHIHQFMRVIRLRGPWDAVVLAEFSVTSFWITWFKAKAARALHVVDFFIGMYETEVEDRALYASSSPRGRLLNLLDGLALRSATVVLADTDVRAEALAARVGSRKQVLTLPVGAPAWARRIEPEKALPLDSLRVLYYGNYIELHGVEFALQALSMLQRETSVTATFVGDGSCKARAVAVARELGLQGTVTFLEPVAESELARLLWRHHVILGVFGGSTKAETVIANKVWQGLSAGRVVVTRNSAALDEIKLLAKGLLLQVEPENAAAIASALRDTHAIMRALEDADQTGIAERLESYVTSRYGQALRALETPSFSGPAG